MMKYPKIIDTLLYKRIDKSTYHVKNGITDVVYEIGTDIVRFMNKLDGKTDPFMINTCLSDFEIEEVLDFLWANELVTKKKWKKIGFLTYGIPLFKVKITQKMRIVSKILNFLLMISFVPIFIVGLYAVKDIYSISMVDKNDFSYLLGLCVGTALGTILHEGAHASAGLGYNAHLFTCGIMIGITPGAFAEFDDEHIKSSLKKAQISAAGVEMNLLLCGLSMICMRLVNSAISLFLGGIAFSNLLLASVNLLPIIGVDGSQIVNNLIGDDLTLYSDILITDKTFLRHMEYFKMKLLSNLFTVTILLIPCILLSIATMKKILVLGVFGVVLLFIYVFFTPLTKGAENFWMYILSTITLLPLNIKITVMLYSIFCDLLNFKALIIFISVLAAFIVWNIEEILLGVTTRIVKPNQKGVDIYEFL